MNGESSPWPSSPSRISPAPLAITPPREVRFCRIHLKARRRRLFTVRARTLSTVFRLIRNEVISLASHSASPYNIVSQAAATLQSISANATWPTRFLWAAAKEIHAPPANGSNNILGLGCWDASHLQAVFTNQLLPPGYQNGLKKSLQRSFFDFAGFFLGVRLITVNQKIFSFKRMQLPSFRDIT